jgi:hypothetical protein
MECMNNTTKSAYRTPPDHVGTLIAIHHDDPTKGCTLVTTTLPRRLALDFLRPAVHRCDQYRAAAHSLHQYAFYPRAA